MSNHIIVRKQILTAIRDKGMNVSEIAEKIGQDPQYVTNQMRRLRMEGRVVMSGKVSKSPLWMATPSNGNEIDFTPEPLDPYQFGLSLRGTPYQGLEAFV
jgi:Winged helix-turn-helix DNA-binding